MSNPSKDHTSIRVHAPPGGHSNNIFGGSEFEQSAANKKKQSESNIFGSNNDNVEPAPVKQNRNMGNNIFGTDPGEANTKAGTLAGQYKQTQMKSNIFGPEEPTPTRVVSDKNKSNIFGPEEPTATHVASDKNKSNVSGTNDPTARSFSDKNKSNIFGPEEPTAARVVSDKNKSNIFGSNDDASKLQTGGIRHGLRDPNASRMGYNPINGESYATKANDKQPEPIAKKAEEENGNAQAASTNSVENTNVQETPVNNTENGSTPAAPGNTTENGNTQAAPTNANGNGNVQKPVEKADNAANVNNAQKNVHTSVRVCHPPGGKSNGPLW
jgi:hypothetical protein